MAFSKARLYNRRSRLTAYFFKVLSHPARQELLLKLAEDDSLPVEILAKYHPVSNSTVSKHMESLRTASFIKFKEMYPYILYALNKKNIQLAKEYMLDFFDRLEKAMNKKQS
ncbi:MAG: helix-turn-helix domain-containing protein [Saprospiraceae bacterium]